jgi:hypothetical protein
MYARVRRGVVVECEACFVASENAATAATERLGRALYLSAVLPWTGDDETQRLPRRVSHCPQCHRTVVAANHLPPLQSPPRED